MNGFSARNRRQNRAGFTCRGQSNTRSMLHQKSDSCTPCSSITPQTARKRNFTTTNTLEVATASTANCCGAATATAIITHLRRRRQQAAQCEGRALQHTSQSLPAGHLQPVCQMNTRETHQQLESVRLWSPHCSACHTPAIKTLAHRFHSFQHHLPHALHTLTNTHRRPTPPLHSRLTCWSAPVGPSQPTGSWQAASQQQQQQTQTMTPACCPADCSSYCCCCWLLDICVLRGGGRRLTGLWTDWRDLQE